MLVFDKHLLEVCLRSLLVTITIIEGDLLILFKIWGWRIAGMTGEFNLQP